MPVMEPLQDRGHSHHLAGPQSDGPTSGAARPSGQAGPPGRAAPPTLPLPGRLGRRFLVELLLQLLEVEARALLHRWELEEGLRRLRNLLLHEDVAPELVRVPILVEERSLNARPFEGVETQVDEDRPIDLDRATQPAVWLIDEPVLVVADAHRTERRLGEVEDLVALRRPLAGDEVHLVVAVQMDLVRAFAELLTFLELLGDIRVTGRGQEGREPVEAGDDPVLDLAGRHLA